MLIFTSYVQNFKKFNRLYASPIFSILGIPFKTHDGRFYSAIAQIHHDYLHLIPLIEHFKYLYPCEINSNEKIDDIKIFFEKMLFLVKLNEIKESKNAEHFLWWALHEKQFLYIIRSQLQLNNDSNLDLGLDSFFDIKTLKILLEALKKYIIDQKKIFNGVSYIFINKANENYSTVLSCIDLLIEVCDKTLNDSNKNNLLNKIKTETIQFYNRNNLNNSKAVYGNNDNNEFRKSLKTPRFNSITRNKFSEIAFGNKSGSPLHNNYFSNPNNT
jgi:hypothetical protein